MSQKSMEIKISSSVSSRQKMSESDRILTFPNPMNNGDHDQDSNAQNFEFKFDHQSGASSASPGSPYKDSPADQLFRNGIMLPHSFPVQPILYSERSYHRSASRASSVGSKDSLISSRSNSTNSRSSSCSSSARTSLSDSSERRMLYNHNLRGYYQKRPLQQPLVLDQVYGSSRRWHFITPVPPISHEITNSKTKKQIIGPQEECSAKKKIKTKRKTSATGSWSFLRFFRYVLYVCRECHALEPSVRNVRSIHEFQSH